MAHDAVDGGSGEAGVAEHRAPPTEPDVGGNDHVASLARRRHHLVQRLASTMPMGCSRTRRLSAGAPSLCP